ncbi:peptide ABC transporter permease [Luteibacter rhizovicinus DSM 16549]|uniref:Peptide ABC transporter permease n=1 Tax=Luteibacter rhizovicinus DSM 16549 TaxID=1440763 RepID=A0A0G9H9T6_9GAMM|nr:ABC transporter permease [Luteibacter rhizovicinus]APG02750.1 peptide ABC transporter permease [Luteibacter rhizovicinus DSM 16549]KLD66363.1 peptide ABC transporter permease [Luteibacter rhizovicinus DSM 16549]KLD76589.1 peptide ABC transporter permease [Xanthomonas hyacinthi DSM 19077]
MFSYYLQLGLRSLRRNPVLTGLMVMAIGFGVAASMTTYSVFRATSRDPIPQKSSQLFNTQLDNWGPDKLEKGEPPQALSYKDATALLRAHKAKRQTITYPIGVSVIPDNAGRLPIREGAYATGADFFPMFDVPFLQGTGWTLEDDEKHASVVVIAKSLNDKLFDGGQSVGKQLNLDGHLYRITGVIEDWAPQPLFFDVPNTGGFDEGAKVYVPFNRAVDLKLPNAGNNSCVAEPGEGWDNYLRSECIWLSLWSELPTKAEADSYRQYIEGYAADQQRAGRFSWAPNIKVRDVMTWLDVQHVVPKESQVSLIVSLGFLVICLVNTIGLLLAKFMRRAPEIGVRRALGASRKDIYAQFLIEAGTIGVAGGVLGLILTGVGILGVGLVFPEPVARLATLDPVLIMLTLVVAIVASLIAAFYPTWRAAQVQPAWQLKSN